MFDRVSLPQLFRYPQRVNGSAKLRPERERVDYTWLDRGFLWFYRNIVFALLKNFHSDARTAKQVINRSEQLASLSDAEFDEHRAAVHARLLREGIHHELVIESFALVREASGRSLGMRHHHTQIRASLILLRGMVAEMATGEGKTLAGTLASSTAAMAGVKVHVITTNDYLASRDCEEMQPLFEKLELKARPIVNEDSIDARQSAYAGDIIYTSNNELVFDYLKDSLVLEDRRSALDIHREVIDGRDNFTDKLMHQGLAFAIVDEADSVFIDESRTPLVISGGDIDMDDEEDFLRTIMEVAKSLIEKQHYQIDWQNRRIVILPEGLELAEEISVDMSTAWVNLIRRQQMLSQALSALHLFERDKHYIVVDEKIVIVDEYTGRPSGDRSWEGGLHQLIEIKESCPLTKPRKTLAKISYQNFFRKYFYLAGMTGTAKEVRGELLNVYGLKVSPVPLLRASKRKQLGYRVLPNQAEKEKAIVESAINNARSGRSVLIGTASVRQSEALAAAMDQLGQDYFLLTAKQDEEEADIVARAGTSGAITIATSMAGRGTDIKLDRKCSSEGGLHVIISELNDSARVDRQLAGRSARQGDPGSVEYILAYDDPLLQMYGGILLGSLNNISSPLPLLRNTMGRWLQRYCQWRLEKKHAAERRQTLKADERERKTLAFLGGDKWR